MSNFCFLKIATVLLCQTYFSKCDFPPCSLENHRYAVTLRVHTRTGLYQFCGGTLLQARWVLTAAHCTIDIDPPSVVHVVALTKPPKVFQRVHVEDIFVTDYYDPKTQENDVALLYTSKAFPSDLPFGKIPSKTFTDHCSEVRIIAWMEKKRARRGDMMVPNCLDVEVIKNIQLCIALFISIADPKTVLCTTAAAGGGQPCRGDSGGPLLCNGVVIGLVSFGLDCKYKFGKSMFARVDNSLDFIRTTMKQRDNTTLKKELLDGHDVYAVMHSGVERLAKPSILVLCLSFKFLCQL